MRQPLSILTRWVVTGVLAGFGPAAIAQSHGFLDINGTFTTIDVPDADSTFANAINDAGHIVGQFTNRSGLNGFGKHGFLDVGGTFTTIDAPSRTPPEEAS